MFPDILLLQLAAACGEQVVHCGSDCGSAEGMLDVAGCSAPIRRLKRSPNAYQY
jgi:hypothetical protein